MSERSMISLALGPVLGELARMNVAYYIEGSVASSFHGAGRSTLDADLMAELDEESALRLATVLSADYYVSASMALDAVRRRSCFNLLHYDTSFKVDVFVSQGREFDRQVLERTVHDFLDAEKTLAAKFASAEDIILIKLEWYRLGNEQSERQWNDVRTVARLRGSLLDIEYLRHWGLVLQLTDLVESLLSEINAEPAS